MSVAAPRSAPLSGRTPPPDWDRVAAWALAHLEELVEETGAKVRRGRCACPLHGGDNPEAFSVSPKGWHCWTGACGGGDGVAFVAAHHHGHLPKEEARMAALRELAPRAGVFLEDRPSRGTRGGAKAGAPGLTQPPPRRAGVGALSGSRESPEGRPPGGPERKAAPDPLPFGMNRPHAPEVVVALREMRAAGAVPASRSAVFGTVLETLTLGPQGRAYLEGRGFDPDAAAAYGFRSVEHRDGWAALLAALAGEYHPAELAAANLATLPAHRTPALVIPYHTPEGAAWTFRTRALGEEMEPRYATLGGDSIPYPFNAPALRAAAGGALYIVEGDLNAAAVRACGERAVGLAGASTPWRPAWSESLRDVARVWAWYDDDEAGRKGWNALSRALLKHLGIHWVNTRLLHVPRGADAAQRLQRGALAPFLKAAPWQRT